MANPIPALMIPKYRGSGDLQFFKLLAGTSLDPAQDGVDVVTALEAAEPTDDSNMGNRMVEAFGKRYAIHANTVRERDEGGAGTWGVVFTLAPMTSVHNHSGIHLMHIQGAPTLVVIWHTNSGENYSGTSTDGTSWNTTLHGTTNGTIGARANSVVLGTSIIWWKTEAGPHLTHIDIQSGAFTRITAPGSVQLSGNVDLHVHKNRVFVAYGINATDVAVARLDGVTPTLIFAESVSAAAAGSGMSLFSDGHELMLFFPDNVATESVYRISDPLGVGVPGSNLAASITTGVTGLGASTDAGWSKFVVVTPEPQDETVYLWYNKGLRNAGTFDLYRYLFRQIAHGAVTGGAFTPGLGYWVEQVTTGARGRVMESSSSALDLTDVTGTFSNVDDLVEEDAAGVLTGVSATSTSLLVDQKLVFLDVGVSAISFGCPNTADGGTDRIPAAPGQRPEWSGIPEEVAGGRTKMFFRLRGSGVPVNLRLAYNVGSEAPDTIGALRNGSVVIESGAPATVPTITDGTTIENITPDAGVTLYSFEHESSIDGILEGAKYAALLDVV